MKNSMSDIKYIEPKIGRYTFTETISDVMILFEVIKFDDSLFLWIGEVQNQAIKDLALAMNTKFSDIPLSTKILGSAADLDSQNLSTKLSKRLKKPVYVSYNLVGDRIVTPAVYERLVKEIQLKPCHFNY